jgi:TIR domain
MPAESPSFLSYSRKDYYFAESLAFHLMRQGVPVWLDVRDLEPGKDWKRGLEEALDTATTVVLVASPDSMESPHVRNEWQRALSHGKRIVLARFRGAKIPAELQQSESVDFRFHFGRALRALVACLKPAAPAAGARSTVGTGNSWIGLPPWVALMAVMLAIPSLAYLLLGNWKPDPSANIPVAVHWALIPVIALLLLWFFCITFLRRRMGMTRLAICLVCLTSVFAIPLTLFGLLGETAARGYHESVIQIARDHWRAGLALTAIPMAGLVVLVRLRPEDLLRWAPTGTAWPIYRIGHVADAAFDRAELGAQFGRVRHFFILHDPADAPMAQHLREQLGASGATEVAADADGATTVLLLTSRTRTAWLDQQTARLPEALLTVVGSAIRLPDSLEGLWRRQWIDFRGWDLQRADREKALPQVPEAVTQPRFPGVVNRVHQMLCALAALLFVLVGKIEQYSGASDDPNLAQIAAAVGALWWGLLARRLLRRSQPEAIFARDYKIGWVATAIAVSLCGYTMATQGGAIGRVLLVVAFLVAAYVWLSRQRKGLAFWLPQERAGREKPEQNLGPGRNWRTLIVFAVYLLIWYLVLGVET